MSVRTLAMLDMLHFHFSHHVEHHLFPAMCGKHYPLVRLSLHKHVGASYVAPTHWHALRVLYRTPRLYATLDSLISPSTGEHVMLSTVTREFSTARANCEGTRECDSGKAESPRESRIAARPEELARPRSFGTYDQP
jgi:hypothetical protein